MTAFRAEVNDTDGGPTDVQWVGEDDLLFPFFLGLFNNFPSIKVLTITSIDDDDPNFVVTTTVAR